MKPPARLALSLAFTLAASTLAAADPGGAVVPDVTGMTKDQAEAAIRKAGLFPDVDDSPSGDSSEDAALESCFNGTRAGTICAQDLAAGSRVARDTRVTAMLGEAADEKVLVMPDLTGLTLDQAQAALAKVGFSQPRPASNYSDACKPKLICAQHFPAGMKVRWRHSQTVDVGQ
jgi:serine/threonine-protein kinase